MSDLAECVSVPGDFLLPQRAFPPGFYSLRVDWVNRPAPEAPLIRGMPTGPLAFLGNAGRMWATALHPDLPKKGLVPHLPVRCGVQQIPPAHALASCQTDVQHLFIYVALYFRKNTLLLVNASSCLSSEPFTGPQHLLMLVNKTYGSPFRKILSGASENHVTVGHVEFREASFTIFGWQTPVREELCLSSSFFRAARTCKLTCVNLFSLHQKNISYQHGLFCGTAFVLFFYSLGHFVMFLNYVYYICV